MRLATLKSRLLCLVISKSVPFFCFPVLSSFAKLGDSDRAVFSSLLPQLEVVPLTFDLAFAAAEARRTYSLKLGDGVIAATALSTNTPLVTRNVRDFKRIAGLEIIVL